MACMIAPTYLLPKTGGFAGVAKHDHGIEATNVHAQLQCVGRYHCQQLRHTPLPSDTRLALTPTASYLAIEQLVLDLSPLRTGVASAIAPHHCVQVCRGLVLA